jgi:tripartite ATP-independent transporter DctM subunit
VLAASTGVVGASVVAMGLISLPVMLRNNYNQRLATGTITAAGTLGQIIPPSIVLIILGDVLNVPVGDLFGAALLPGVSLIGCYIAYILLHSYLLPDHAPALPVDAGEHRGRVVLEALVAIVPPLALILVVLGSIFTGVATPTESSALGCIGAVVLSVLSGSFSPKMLWESCNETVKITAMVFAVLIGASVFSMGFSYSGGEEEIEHLLLSIPGDKWGFLAVIMSLVLILGFFLDYIEISYIVIPLVYPVAEALEINMIWFAVLLAMNLQTSFLTPPFGFALFYLKGVVGNSVKTLEIYRGVVPFIIIQFLVLMCILFFPGFFGLQSEAVSLW